MYYGFEDNEFTKRQKELEKMKLELTDLQKSFNESPGLKLGSYDVTGRENPNPDTTLGVTDFSSMASKGTDLMLGKQDFGKFQDGVSETATAMDPSAEAGGFFSKDSNFLGTKGQNVGASSVAAGMKAMTMAQTTANNEGESIMSGIDMTMKGAQAGMAIGGPWGAAIGGAVGLGYGIYDGFADANKRGRMEREANKKKFIEDKTKREQEWRMEEGKDSQEKLARIRKAQMDYLI